MPFNGFNTDVGSACIDWTLPDRRCRIPPWGPLCWSRCRCPGVGGLLRLLHWSPRANPV